MFNRNPSNLPNWIRWIGGPGVTAVAGRHSTPRSKKAAEELAAVAALASMVHSFFLDWQNRLEDGMV